MTPNWTEHNPFGGSPIPYYVQNETPTMPDDCHCLVSSVIKGRGRRSHHRFRISVVQRSTGERFTHAEEAIDLEGSTDGVVVRFCLLPQFKLDGMPWLLRAMRKLWDDFHVAQARLPLTA